MKATKITSIPVFAGLLFGYHIGVIGPALPLLIEKLNIGAWLSGHLVSIFIIGLIIGAFITKKVINRFGRRQSLIFVTLGIISSAIFGFFAASFLLIFTYRLLSGVFAGMIATLGPMLAVENSNTEKRASLSSVFQICIALGVALSYFLGLKFMPAKDTNLMFLSAGFIAIIALYFYIKLPKLKEPHDVISYSFKEMKRSYMIAIGINFFQQASGINAITFFIQTLLSEKLQGSINLAYLLPMIVNVVSVIATLLMMKKINKWGRKPFLMIGSFGMSLAMLILALNNFSVFKEFSVLLLFTLSFGLSFGPITYLITNEVFTDKTRAAGSSLAFFANCLTNYGISLIFLPLRNLFGAPFMWSFFSIMSIMALIFVWRKVPETNHLKCADIVKKLNSR